MVEVTNQVLAVRLAIGKIEPLPSRTLEAAIALDAAVVALFQSRTPSPTVLPLALCQTIESSLLLALNL